MGTAFRPGGQYRHHRCEPWLQPQSGSEHRDSHAHRCAPRDSTADWWKLQTWSFSLPTGSQPDNWTPLHTEIRIPKPAWVHLVSAPTLPHPHHRASHIPPDPTPGTGNCSRSYSTAGLRFIAQLEFESLFNWPSSLLFSTGHTIVKNVELYTWGV